MKFFIRFNGSDAEIVSLFPVRHVFLSWNNRNIITIRIKSIATLDVSVQADRVGLSEMTKK